MKAKELIELYKEHSKKKAINDIADLVHWMEDILEAKMDKPLVVNCGLGGGQLFSVLHKAHKENTSVYFFSEMEDAVSELLDRGHTELQTWINKHSGRAYLGG